MPPGMALRFKSVSEIGSNIQEAMTQPEARFQEGSFLYRPNRGSMQYRVRHILPFEKDLQFEASRLPAGYRARDDHFCNVFSTIAPISAGDSTTWIPASRIAFIFSAAVPFPPAMMAPAWPMRRPGGAV